MKSKYRVIGLMSGSSLDGIDISVSSFEIAEQSWNHRIDSGITIPYPPELVEKLSDAIHLSHSEIRKLDVEVGQFYGHHINNFLDKESLEVDFISSHGHTVYHQPEKGITLQIGNGKEISEITGLMVINNFRNLDVQHGGQGAPLVPVGDRLLFGEYDVCINIGGIVNISYEYEGNRVAYDICPGNMLLNFLVEELNLPFDNRGSAAAQGKIDQTLLDTLENLSYYQNTYPKSLGKEWFESTVIPVIMQSGINVNDKLCTSSHHIARQVAKEINRSGGNSILLTGGGAHNQFLVNRIIEYSGKSIQLPHSNLIDYKESHVFAFLGILRSRNEVNCYASVTGASRDLSTGDIHSP